jgi:hypothetical protein
VTQLLSKQRPLLGNARNIHSRKNKTARLCYPFLSNGSVNTRTTIRILEKVFSIRSVQSGYKEDLVENRQSSSGVPSVQFVESWALQGRLGRWRYGFMCGELTSWQRRDDVS